MNPYSHLVTASRLEGHLRPGNLEEYYLGAVIPDVRYYSGLPREQTHIPAEQIVRFADLYPQLASFVLGYLVHWEVDELEASDYVMRRFPFSLLRRRLPAQVAPVLVECYYIDAVRLNVRVSESSNEILDALGVAPEAVTAFARSVNHFLADPSLELGLTTIQELGLLARRGVEKYVEVARTIHRNGVLRRLLFTSIDTASLERELVSRVSSSDLFAPWRSKARSVSRESSLQRP